MLQNYIKTAWRNLKKGKLFSFINIAGLSIGMAVTMIIGIWVWDELSLIMVSYQAIKAAMVNPVRSLRTE